MTPNAGGPDPAASRRDEAKLRLAFLISSAGDWIYRFAVPTLILKITGSATSTAFAYILEFVPYVVIGPAVGVVADRLDRRRLLVGCDAASCGMALVIALLATAPRPPVAALYLCAFSLSCLRPVYFPAFQGFLVDTVAQDRRPRFNSWIQATDGSLSLLGPVLGTAIVAAAGPALASTANAASFATSSLLVLAIRDRRPAPSAERSARSRPLLRAEFAAGLRVLRSSRALLSGTILITGANLAAYIIEANLVYLVLHAEHRPKLALGIAFGAQGLGAVTGAALTPRLLGARPAGKLLTAGMALSLLAMTVPALAPVWPAVVAGQAVEGAATSLIVVCWFTTLQKLIPSDVIGRFVAVGRAIAYSSIPLGALLGGWILGNVGSARMLFVAAAAIQVTITVATALAPVTHIAADAGSDADTAAAVTDARTPAAPDG